MLENIQSKVRARDPFPSWQNIVVVAWTGMRGVVSLAAALALPVTINNGNPFPQRTLIIFLTFSVILATLVIQGLTLPLLIKALKVVDDGGVEHEENKARLKAAHAGRKRLEELAETEQWVSTELVEKLGRQYEARIRRFGGRYKGNRDGVTEEHFSNYERLQEELILAELASLLDLRNEGIINDEVLRRVQHDLDLHLLRLRGE